MPRTKDTKKVQNMEKNSKNKKEQNLTGKSPAQIIKNGKSVNPKTRSTKCSLTTQFDNDDEIQNVSEPKRIRSNTMKDVKSRPKVQRKKSATDSNNNATISVVLQQPEIQTSGLEEPVVGTSKSLINSIKKKKNRQVNAMDNAVKNTTDCSNVANANGTSEETAYDRLLRKVNEKKESKKKEQSHINKDSE